MSRYESSERGSEKSSVSELTENSESSEMVDESSEKEILNTDSSVETQTELEGMKHQLVPHKEIWSVSST